MKTIEETLTERGKQHGDFNSHCDIERALRDILNTYGTELDNTMYIGAGMLVHKLSRILNNGAKHADTWHDIAGYATLVEKHVIEINEYEAKVVHEQEEIANER